MGDALRDASRKRRLAVIGNGMAGARLVEEIVARGGRDRFDIVMFGDEPYGNYNRIRLSDVIAGHADPKEIFLNPLAWYQENGIKLHAGTRVHGIDRRARVVHAKLREGSAEGGVPVSRCGASHDGVLEPYDVLVLATGSSAAVPPLERLRLADGSFREGAFVFRTLDDCAGMIKRARTAKKAVVVGGGLLGLEAARGLAAQGLEVHVVHLMKHLMEVQLDASAAKILLREIESRGIKVHLGTATCGVIGDPGVEGVLFADGKTLDCDLLVLATGIRPNTQLAIDSGLNVERGIVVDDAMQTDDECVYAVGECAQHRGVCYGLVAPLWEQVNVLADRLTGKDPNAEYTGSKLSTKLKVAGIDLTVMGDRDPAEDDEVVTYSEPARGVYKKMLVRDGKLAGAILLGDSSNAPTLLEAFAAERTLPELRAEMLFPIAAEQARPSLAALADDAQICNCNGVSKGAIALAVKRGCTTLKKVCDATRAGLGCGGCKKDVEQLLQLVAGDAASEDPSIHWYVPGVPLTKPELVEAIRAKELKSVSSVFSALAGGREDAASKPGLASLLKTLWGKAYVDERDARFINDRVHANIQNDGTFSVVPRIFGGVTSPAELRKIADVAEKHGARMVKITGGQRIDLLGIRKEKLPEVWKDLGMACGHAYTKAFRTCKTCVGSEFCRYGVGDSTALGIAIEKKFQGIETPGKLKLATAGCPRNCSEALVKDIGAVAIEGGRWEIYVGGAAGARVRKGDLLCTVSSHEEVLRMTGRFMQYYRENAKWLERTYDFVERVGIEHVRRVVVEDAEGIAAALDASIEASIDAFVDPWASDAERPATPNQFREAIESKPIGQLVQLRRAAGGRR